MNIGWIGTGNMGLRMAMRLIAAGNRLFVYNRTKEKAAPLIETGMATLLDSPKDIFEKSDIIFSSITSDLVWDEMLAADGFKESVREGQVLVEMSTLSPDYAQKLRGIMHGFGCTYIDAPVIGSMFMIEQGLLKVLVSGDRDAYDAVLPYLMSIGKTVSYMGAGSEARYMKIAVNMIICSYLTIYGELLLAGEAMGLCWDELNDLLEASEGAGPMLFDKGTLHRSRVWGSQAALTSTALKDLGLALKCAKNLGFELPLTAVVCQYDRFMHFNKKYETYSSFGTIGVLEDICGISAPEQSKDVSDEDKEALSDALTAVTTVLAAETFTFCRKTGISIKDAAAQLGLCHGASKYLSAVCRGEQSTLTLKKASESVDRVLSLAAPSGAFLPITGEASQVLGSKCAAASDETLLENLFR